MTDVAKPEKIRCDACPVMCYIAEGNSGACDRYANHGGELVLENAPLEAVADWDRAGARIRLIFPAWQGKTEAESGEGAATAGLKAGE